MWKTVLKQQMDHLPLTFSDQKIEKFRVYFLTKHHFYVYKSFNCR
jgi:hypothetical protein